MNPDSQPRPEGFSRDPEFAEGRHGRCCGRAQWPLTAAAVGGAFWLFPPLGVASLAYLAMRGGRGRGHGHGHGPDFAEAMHHRGRHGFGGFGFRRGRHGRGSSGNVAFDEARAEAWQRLEEEAAAFDDFRRRDRAARDREVYDRFRSERADAPAKPEAGAPEA
jgi:hypothetical protein